MYTCIQYVYIHCVALYCITRLATQQRRAENVRVIVAKTVVSVQTASIAADTTYNFEQDKTYNFKQEV